MRQAILIFLACLFGTSAFAQKTLTREEFALAHANIIQWMNAANVAYVRGVKRCYCNIKKISNCKNALVQEVSLKAYYRGDQTEEIKTCEDVVQNDIDTNTQELLHDMRVNIALYQFFSYQEDLGAMFMSHGSDIVQYMKRGIAHPFKGTAQVPMLDPLSTDSKNNEYVDAKEQARKQFEMFCQIFKSKNPKLESYLKKDSNCNDLLMLSKHPIYADDDLLARRMMSGFQGYITNAIEIYKKQFLFRYDQIIKQNGIILLLSHPTFSTQEMYEALGVVEEKAEDRFKKSKDGNMLSDDWFLENVWALPYTAALLQKNYSDKQSNEVIQKYVDDIKRAQMIKAVEVGAGLVGGFVMCNLVPKEIPALQGLLLLDKLSGRNLCRIAGAVIADGYFYSSTLINSSYLFDRMRSILDSNYAAVSGDELLANETQLKLIEILFPLNF
jgi:hypothetical protein